MSRKFDKDKFMTGLIRFGSGLGQIFKDNSGTIIGGGIMLGMALLCKRLDVPYQVLTDPFDFGTAAKTPTKGKFILLPNNATEAAMSAIYDTLDSDDWDTTKEDAANKIYKILVEAKKNSDGVSENTKTYAINLLRGIVEKIYWSSTKERVNQLIVKIGTDSF